MRAPSPSDREALTLASPISIRGGLFRKYVALFVAVVCMALIANGMFEIWFAYQEHKGSLVRIQREQAEAAAAKLEQFVKEIESQVGWTTQLPWSAGTIEQRRFDALRLLRQVPAVTELALLDASGHEQLRVSRLAMDVVGSNLDLSADPKFTEAVAHKVYYGPVYFRRESEPYMTLALAGTRPRERRQRRRGQSQADVGRSLADQGRRARRCLCGRPRGPPDRASRYQPGAAQHRHVAVGAGAGGATGRRQHTGGDGSGGARHCGARGADRACAGHAARLVHLRRAAGRGSLCAALCLGRAHRRRAARRADLGIAGRPAAGAPHGGTYTGSAHRRRAHRRRRFCPAHLD